MVVLIFPIEYDGGSKIKNQVVVVMNCAIDDADPHRRGNQGIQRCLDTIKTLVEKVLLKYSLRGSLLFSALDT